MSALQTWVADPLDDVWFSFAPRGILPPGAPAQRQVHRINFRTQQIRMKRSADILAEVSASMSFPFRGLDARIAALEARVANIPAAIAAVLRNPPDPVAELRAETDKRLKVLERAHSVARTREGAS